MPSMELIQTDNLLQTFVLNLRTIIGWTDVRLSSSTTLSEYVEKRIDPKFLDCFWKPFILTVNLVDEPEEHIQALRLIDPSGEYIVCNLLYHRVTISTSARGNFIH